MRKQIAKTLLWIYKNIKADDQVQKTIRKRLVDNLLWASTEYNEKGENIKYYGQKYWSDAAIKTYIENNPINGTYAHRSAMAGQSPA